MSYWFIWLFWICRYKWIKLFYNMLRFIELQEFAFLALAIYILYISTKSEKGLWRITASRADKLRKMWFLYKYTFVLFSCLTVSSSGWDLFSKRYFYLKRLLDSQEFSEDCINSCNRFWIISYFKDSLITEVIHCRIYRSDNCQWESNQLTFHWLLPWKV